MAKLKDEHVVMGGKGFRCLHCGVEQALSYPMSINVLDGAAKGFTKDHVRCKASASGKARFEYSTPEEWASSWDTGTSSLLIYHVLGGGARPPDLREGRYNLPIPYDPADFGRCYRLLEVAPGWSERLPEVASLWPCWKPFVEAWPDLVTLWKAEEPTGEAPQLFARIQGLVEQARKAHE